MPLGVGERERAPPRSADHQPALDAEVRPEPLDVRDEVRRGVVAKVDTGRARARRAPPAVALVEQDDPVSLQVEQPTLP